MHDLTSADDITCFMTGFCEELLADRETRLAYD